MIKVILSIIGLGLLAIGFFVISLAVVSIVAFMVWLVVWILKTFLK